jgi:hypothetical protein
LITPACTLHAGKLPTHTSDPMQSHDAVPPQAAGIGSQRGHPCGPNATSCTHTVPSGHSAHSGTTSHSAAGTHFPVQHAGDVSATSPAGHGGGSESHATLLPSQLSRSVWHTPNRHIAFSTPYSEHFACLHCISQSVGFSPTGTPSHAQQSLCSLQSPSTAHASAPPPVVSDPPPVDPPPVVPPPPVVSDPVVALAPVVVTPPELDPSLVPTDPPVVPLPVAPPVVTSPELLPELEPPVSVVSPFCGPHPDPAIVHNAPNKQSR